MTLQPSGGADSPFAPRTPESTIEHKVERRSHTERIPAPNLNELMTIITNRQPVVRYKSLTASTKPTNVYNNSQVKLFFINSLRYRVCARAVTMATPKFTRNCVLEKKLSEWDIRSIDDLCSGGTCQSCQGRRESAGASTAVDYTGQERRERRYLTNLTSNQLVSHGGLSAGGSWRGGFQPHAGINRSVPSPLHGLSNRQEREGTSGCGSLTAALFGTLRNV